MSYNIKLYKNTMFDAVNVPDSYELLDNGEFEYDEFEDVNLVQGRYLINVRLTYDPSEANKVDYVVLTNNETNDKTAYVVNSYRMVTEDTCDFYLLLEPFLTMGGIAKQTGEGQTEPGVVVLGGVVKRMHVPLTITGEPSKVTGSDETTFYMGNEPFTPQRHPDFEVKSLLDVSDTQTFIETLSIPSKLITDNKVVLAGQTITTNTGPTRESSTSGATTISDIDATTAVSTLQYTERSLPRQLESTNLTIDGNKIALGTRWWNEKCRYYTDVTYIGLDGKQHKASGDIVGDLIMDGRFSDVSGYWEVPSSFISSASYIEYKPYNDKDEDVGYGGILGVVVNTKNINIPIKTFGYKPYNNKCYYGQSNIIKIFNPVSGASIEREIQDIISPTATPKDLGTISGYIGADVRPTGQPFFGFSYLFGADNKSTPMEVVNGGNWRQLNLTSTGISSGSNIANISAAIAAENIQQKNSYLEREFVINTLGNGLSTVASTYGQVKGGNGNTLKAASEGFSYVTNFARDINITDYQIWENNKSVKDQNTILQAQAATASVTLKATNLNYFCDINKNTFYSISSHFDDVDMEQLDTFYERFGYNVGSIRASNFCFWTRPKFNFVQSDDIQFFAPNANINVINDVKERLKSGLRVWHVKPNTDLTLPGCNR